MKVFKGKRWEEGRDGEREIQRKRDRDKDRKKEKKMSNREQRGRVGYIGGETGTLMAKYIGGEGTCVGTF